MYNYRPPRRPKKATLLVLILLFASTTALGVSALAPPLPRLWQCVGLLLLIPAIQLVSRYFLLQYLYRLRPNAGGGVDFEVYTYRRGDRMQLVCRVALSEMVRITPIGQKSADRPAGIRRFSYLPDLAPAGAVVISVKNADGDSEIAVLPDEGMLSLLRQGMQPPELFDPAKKTE